MPIGESAPVIPPPRPAPHPAPAPTPVGGTATVPALPLESVPPPAPVPAPDPAPAEPPAPADLDRIPGRRERFAWYAGTVLLSCLLVAGGYRLDRVSFTAPFYYDMDALLILPMVKATLERGSHWRNERLGFPGIQELHDFPVVDHLHLAIIWVLGRFLPDPVVLYNLYYLLTYPLTALTALAVLRWLRLTLPAASAGALLYAFQPYHHLRGELHFFLAAYWMIPLSWIPALMICRGEFPFFPRQPDGTRPLRLRRWGTLWQVLLAAATASAGAYYAFFACALYAVCGAYAGVAFRAWRAAAAAGLVVAVVGVFGVLNHLPAFRYVAANERNSVTDRNAYEAEVYGMKVAQLLLPIDDHNVTAFARVKSRFNDFNRPLNNENNYDSLGVIASAGLLLLVGVLLLPVRRNWPYGPLAAVTGFVLLFATIGGFGGLFNLLVFDQVRCHNRFSIYLAFVCLFVVLWPLDRFLLTRTGRARWARYPALVLLAGLGISDQTPSAWFRDPVVASLNEEAERFRADHRFFTKVEEELGPGGKVFTLPYMPFPEVPPRDKMNTYEPVRGYLHTNTLVWSYGAIKNREADAWHRQVAAAQDQLKDNPGQLLRRLVFRGFDGLFIDTRGFAVVGSRNTGEQLVASIKSVVAPVKLPEIWHEDGKQVFLDLRPYREGLRRQDPVYFENEARREREWACVTWLRGFRMMDPYGVNDRLRWVEPAAVAVIVNPAEDGRTRKFLLSAVVGTDRHGVFRVSIDGGGLVWLNRPDGPGPWADEVVLDKKPGDWDPPVHRYGERRSYLIEVPPGRHAVHFRCQLPDKYMPGEARDTCYFLKDISFVEVP